MENKITKIIAEEIRDSRGNPTILVSVYVGEKWGTFAVPSGASTGLHEAFELKDPDKGVKSVLEKINQILVPALIGKNVLNQKEIDLAMIALDGTSNKSNLGGNALIGLSIACAKVAAKIQKIELYEYLRTLAEIKPSRKVPHLYMNLINGGVHARNDLAFQEYHIVPQTENIEEAVDIGLRIQDSLKEIFLEELGEDSLTLGDEGGYAPQINDIQKPLEYLQKAIIENNLTDKVFLALDVAASSFYQNEKYLMNGEEKTKEEFLEVYDFLLKNYKILSIEDPFEEEDFSSFAKLKKNYPNLIVMGDDLTVTNKTLLQKAIDLDCINAMIIKPNQIGTLTETLETMALARENNIELIVSHRSGETDDDFIADLAYAFGTFGLKSGSPLKEERMIKYQRLINILKNEK
jgi:enolase